MTQEKNSDSHGNLMKLMAVMLAILYMPMFFNLWQWWAKNPNYGHAFFIPLASVYLVWKKRKIIKDLTVKSEELSAVFLFVVSFLIYMLGFRIEMFRLCIVSFLISIFAFVLFFYGRRIAREFVFPVGFMLFMIPVPLLDDLTAPMKLMASAFSAGFLTLINIPVYREGNVIFLPNFTLEVATACSGLRSLVLVTTLSVFYGYLVFPKISQRIVLFLLSVPIAIIANISRIITVGLISEVISQRALFHFVHDFSGIFVFIVAGAILALTARLIEHVWS